MFEYTYPLEQAPEDPAVVGGKAASLTRLVRAGLRVPPGFVVTAAAFRTFVAENGLDGKLGVDDADALALLRDAHWPRKLRVAIELAYAGLRDRANGVPVAARSSATVEDSAGASFAGQHATLLNLDGFEAVLDGVIECWASLYSAEALHYRQARAVDDDHPAMAVVVQALVPSEASGVAFTLDPVTGNTGLVVIEAAWGLGEGVVGGIVTPDHFEVNKVGGEVVRRQIANKRVQVAPLADGGVETQELPAARAQQPALDDAQLAELTRVAVQLEELAGAPQDIEWAVAGGVIYLLQARPVTAAGVAPPPQTPADESPASESAPASEGWFSEFDTPTSPDTIWTAANVQEVLPDQLSPFGTSVTKELIERLGKKPIERIGIQLGGDEPFSGYFYGRAFLNVSMMIDIADQTPFGSVEALMEQFFGMRRDDVAPPKELTGDRVRRYAAVLPKMLVVSGDMPRQIERAEQIVEEFDREEAARPAEQLTDDELLRRLQRELPRGGIVAVIHVGGGGMTSSMFEWLRRVTENWLGDETGALQARLCTGLSGVESAQPAYELWDLSRLVLGSEALRAAFEPHDGAEIERRLMALPVGERAAFEERLQTFLTRHGYRSVMEAEMSARTWAEDVPTVLAMIRNYLEASDELDPRRVEERQRGAREAVTQRSLRRLSWWQIPPFKLVLSQAQHWVVAREHTKSLMVRATHHGRRLTRELARRLVRLELLENIWDFYYLTWGEVKALYRRELPRAEAYEHVARRREEEERNRSVVLPETFRGHPKPLTDEEQALPGGNVLYGIAVSPGRVTGRARVVLDPRKDAAVEPGEVLVAPVTDAGWTPLFIPAAAIVVDIGGSLSHGSIVAREYGLPAVVNVKHGTRMIRTGQRITVDGDRGIVLLEDDGP